MVLPPMYSFAWSILENVAVVDPFNKFLSEKVCEVRSRCENE